MPCKSWFKRFEVCAAANDWNAAKKLLRVPTLLKGRAWAVFDSLTEAETDSYDHLKSAVLAQLAPDSDEERMRARDELSQRRYREGLESVDELARDIEKLLDRAAPGLEGAVRTTELRFYLIWCFLFSNTQGFCYTTRNETGHTHEANQCRW